MPNPGKKILKKKLAKKFKKLKNFFPALFLARTGWDWARRGEKNFSPEFHSYSTPERKFQKKISKKIKKIKKLLSNIIFSQNEMRLGEKGRKNFLSRIPFILDPGKKILNKNWQKNSKN